VTATSAVDHSYAYVGPDLQDAFGIDPNTITGATTLRDSYFVGGGADQMLARLRGTPDGILVAQETISDYSLNVGDLLRLRVLDHRTGRFHIVPFHVVGTVAEFPSAPRDSFMIANLSYLSKADHAGGANVVFASTSGDPATVGSNVAAVVKPLGASVRDVSQQTLQTVSSITTVSLNGISHILEVFAIVLAAAALAILMIVTVVERRHEFATMAALGAPWRRISGFLWSEAGIVLGAAILLAAVLGFVLSEMLVAMLKHAFDPPPDHLAIPIAYMIELLGAAILAGIVGCAVGAQAIRRLRIGRLLREQ
jgi:putative ABC transport system permease protein